VSRKLCLLAGAALAVTLGITTAMAQDAPPIKIGMSVSSTGAFALAAQSGKRGVDIWVDDVNRRGGIELGGKKRKVELVILDDRSDKQLVPRVYETLINENKVDLVFGPFGSTLTAAAATTTENANKFLVIWSASADSIYRQGYKYVVSATQTAGTLIGQPIVRALHAKGVKKIAFAYVDEPFPASLTQGAVDLAKELGMEVTMHEKWPKGAKDFNILLQKARASGAEVFFPTAYEGDQMVIARQARELNVDFSAIVMNYGVQPQFLAIGKDALYLISATLLHDQINWKVTDGLNRAEMIARYKELFPNAPFAADFQTILAYGAGVIVERLIKDSQSLDAAKLKETALSLNGKTIVATGEYHIEPTGRQIKMGFSVMQNLPSGIEVIYPPGVATSPGVFPVPKFQDRK
jgi:branched-chain amino acid transport system substrate-binding protein